VAGFGREGRGRDLTPPFGHPSPRKRGEGLETGTATAEPGSRWAAAGRSRFCPLLTGIGRMDIAAPGSKGERDTRPPGPPILGGVKPFLGPRVASDRWPVLSAFGREWPHVRRPLSWRRSGAAPAGASVGGYGLSEGIAALRSSVAPLAMTPQPGIAAQWSCLPPLAMTAVPGNSRCFASLPAVLRSPACNDRMRLSPYPFLLEVMLQ